jgi:ketosteroid isomerase-like protein
MTMSTPAEVEAEIHAIMKARVEAVHAKDAARLLAHHAADVVAYDLLEPLQYKGLADLRRRIGLQDMMSDSHPQRADRMMKAMLKMKKIDIQRLKDAYDGR